MKWKAPPRPAAYAEQALVSAIVQGEFPPDSYLPGERDLAAQLGVTRPTLREVLQRLERDGWVTIQHGKSTRVNDYWREGGLNVLSALVQLGGPLPANFVPNLLVVRLLLAPAYTRLAVTLEPGLVALWLADAQALPDLPQAFANFDWRLHHNLTVVSGNPIFTLILNGFSGFYEEMALRYFAAEEARRASRAFYSALHLAAQQANADQAEKLTRKVMQESIEIWKVTSVGGA